MGKIVSLLESVNSTVYSGFSHTGFSGPLNFLQKFLGFLAEADHTLIEILQVQQRSAKFLSVCGIRLSTEVDHLIME